MSALYYLLGVLIFVVAILASIGLHEFGHMIPAKKFGGKVTQWMIGFGPTVWSRRRGETEYGLKAIPLGGFVKIVGMLPPEKASGRLRGSSTGLFTQLISDARAAEWEHVKPGDEDRLFYKMTWWKKVVVMAGGPTVNLLIAFFLFSLVFGFYGIKSDAVDSGRPVIDTVARCVIPYAEEGRACRSTDHPTPAYDAGLRPGDVITTFNGTPITGWNQLRTLIRGNEQGRAVIGFQRDGRTMTATTNTTVEARPTSQSDQTLRQVGFLGVTPSTHVVTTRGGPVFTLQQMGGMTVDTVKALGTLPVKVWGVAKAIAGVEPRSPDSPVSIVGGGRLAGETAASTGFPLVEKAVFLLMLIAGFNFFIGMFNFIPLLPLDGGHIAGALYEAVRRAFYRLRGRPDPGYVDVAKLLPIAYVMASVLLVLGLVLIVGDLVVPIHLEG